MKDIQYKSIREHGYTDWEYETGPRNLITDVPGVRVGQVTLDDGEVKTGVTAILPCEGLIFEKKPVAAVFSLNGFGKTCGTVQIEELGVIETPILLTNTLNVGKAADALVEYTIRECEKAGKQVRSVNPVVGETNDSRINNILLRSVEKEHVLAAIDGAGELFEQGNVGAGKGTVCCGLKGGIGSASRQIAFGDKTYTVGVLVQSNFGRLSDLTVCGEEVGKQIEANLRGTGEQDKGSIMMVVATDVPLSSRQLQRVLRRCSVGLVRTGSRMGHGSGDVFIGFTTSNYMPDAKEEEILSMRIFPENKMDRLFRPVAEAVEEAILNSMTYARPEKDRDGKTVHSLAEYL